MRPTSMNFQKIMSFWTAKWPCINLRTLPDELFAKHMTWRVYRGVNSFTQSLAMVRNVRQEPAKWSHVFADTQMGTDIHHGMLPGVSWLIPGGSTPSIRPRVCAWARTGSCGWSTP